MVWAGLTHIHFRAVPMRGFCLRRTGCLVFFYPGGWCVRQHRRPPKLCLLVSVRFSFFFFFLAFAGDVIVDFRAVELQRLGC